MLTWTATVEDFAPYPNAREPTSKPRRAKLSGTIEAGLSSFSRRMAIDRITRDRGDRAFTPSLSGRLFVIEYLRFRGGQMHVLD